MPRTTKYEIVSGALEKIPDVSKEATWSAMGGIGLFIPLSSRVPLLIETGLRYRYAPALFYGGYRNGEVCGVEDGASHHHFIELPLKFDYDLRFNESNSLRFGMGVYGAYMFGYEAMYGDSHKVGISAGIEPSITYCHRGISVGLSYTNPIIFAPMKNKLADNLTLTFGIKFKSGAWKYVGVGLGSVATLGLAAATVYQSSQSSSGHSSGYSSSSSSYGDAMSADSSGNVDGNTCKMMYEKWEKRAQAAFEALDGHSGSAGTYQIDKKLLREAQKEMRSWRRKASKAGVIIPQSIWENKTVKLNKSESRYE